MSLTKQLEDKINQNLNSHRMSLHSDSKIQKNSVELSPTKIFYDITKILTAVMDQFGKSKFFQKFSQDDKTFKDKQAEYKYTIDFVNLLAKLISLSKTCEKYISVSKIIGKNANKTEKRQSFNKNKSNTSKENSMINNIIDERKKPSSRKNSKKQSNYLNYKKQINSSRNHNLANSSSMKTYFYSTRSGVDNSTHENNEISSQAERQSHEMKCPKPTLKKTWYDANLSNLLMVSDLSFTAMKKLTGERKGSIPNNYSIITDNFVASNEDSLVSKYNTARNDKLKIPASKLKYNGKNFNSKPKLPLSKSVKNMHDRDAKHANNESGVISSPHRYKQPSTTKNTIINGNKGNNLLIATKPMKYGYTTSCVTSRNQYLNTTGLQTSKQKTLGSTQIAKNKINGTRKPNALLLKGSSSRKAFRII